jgi:hypothetical protein
VNIFDANSFHALHEENGGKRATADLVRDVPLVALIPITESLSAKSA